MLMKPKKQKTTVIVPFKNMNAYFNSWDIGIAVVLVLAPLTPSLIGNLKL